MKDLELEVRFHNILREQEDTVTCPHCGALNTAEDLTLGGPGINSWILCKTVVCSVCKQEWLPNLLVMTEEMKGKIWPSSS